MLLSYYLPAVDTPAVSTAVPADPGLDLRGPFEMTFWYLMFQIHLPQTDRETEPPTTTAQGELQSSEAKFLRPDQNGRRQHEFTSSGL